MGVEDISQLYPELGASISFQGGILLVNVSVFLNNTGFKGGAIYVSSYISDDIKQEVTILHSYFKGNRGNLGGAINLSFNLRTIDIVLFSCIFHSNMGKGKSKI